MVQDWIRSEPVDWKNIVCGGFADIFADIDVMNGVIELSISPWGCSEDGEYDRAVNVATGEYRDLKSK